MLNKFFILLLGVILAFIAYTSENQVPIIEGWNYGAMKWQTQNQKTLPSGQMVAIPGNPLVNTNNGLSFISNPQFQAMMAPRFPALQEQSAVLYNMPQDRYRAAPKHPMSSASMANEGYNASQNANQREGYCGDGSCGGADNAPPKCGIGGSNGVARQQAAMMPPAYANGNFNEVTDSVTNSATQVLNSLPLGTMSSMDASGNETQVEIASQFMYANPRSRLRAMGDPIRGDLAILPCTGANGQWFVPSVSPFLDLQPGAMNVMGGFDNSQGQALAQLMTASAGVPAPLAGIADPVPISFNTGSQYMSSSSQGGTMVSIGTLP